MNLEKKIPVLLCKFEKKNPAIYSSHLAVMRAFHMAIRRAGLSIAYSTGFNPHPRLFMSQPMPVGQESECEYFAAESVETPTTFIKKINPVLQEGIKILKCVRASKNPNFVVNCFASRYEIVLGEKVKLPDFAEILKADSYQISFKHKGENITKDVRSMIFDMKQEDNVCEFTLSSSSHSLRPDRLINHLLKLINAENICYSVTKKEVFDKSFTSFDKLFFA
ncbi:MAG: TIGR03936 family radical SAM-associated protein [Firmicutes bacterium]|nr:TIGR03936 family radical SAM-associated protein [Bacillota bacterium]